MRLLLVSALLSSLAVLAPFGSMAAPRRALSASHDDAAYARHVARLRERLPDGEFHIVVEKPFVIVSDAPPDELRSWTESVRFMGEKLRAGLFEKAPAHIVDLFLFQDRDSYEANALHLFKEEPETPYGYYLPDDRALVMNMSTGRGTLVHELVHPYLEANFPEAPPWFDEGLASLFERTALRDGQLVGLRDWRLRSLQSELEEGSLPTLRELLAMNAREFDSDDGDNYAQARYLLFYLQGRGLLAKFYRVFRQNHADDSTGYATLRRVLGISSDAAMEKFEGRFAQWVAGLEVPER